MALQKRDWVDRSRIQLLNGKSRGYFMSGTYQEGTQHEEADEIDNSKVATTSEFLPRFKIRLRVTALARQAG